MAPSVPDICRIKMRFISPTGDGKMRESEGPVKKIMDEAEKEEQDEDGTEQHKEVARTIQKETVGGIEIDRIIRTTFEKPSGKRYELVFAEAQDDVDADAITTEA